MSSEESNKTSKQTPSLDSVYDDLLDAGNEIGPDVTDMLWTAAKKQALRDREVVSRQTTSEEQSCYKYRCSECYELYVHLTMLSILLALTLANHDDGNPYGWHMSCERFLERRVEILMDDNLDRRSKYNLLGYLRSKVDGQCDQMLVQ